MRKLVTALSFLMIFLFTVSVAAAAGTAISPENGALLDLARPIYDAVMHGQWWLAASFALIVLVAAFKKYAPGKLGEWGRSDIGGSILVLAGSFGGALATGLLAAGTNSLTTALAWTALKIAIAAAGGFTLLKKLAMPFVRRLADVAPNWAKPILAIVLWAFDKNVVETAEAAGDDAVAATPGSGADGVVGPATDL